MNTTFNKEVYETTIRNVFIKALNSDALKYSAFKNGNHRLKAILRAQKYVPGGCFCENINALCCIATINGCRDIEENGKKKRVGVIRIGKNELLIDFTSLTERHHPFTGVCGDNAYKSINSDVYVKSEILDSSKSLLQLFEADEICGKKCLLRYTVPAFNERGERTNIIVLDALWTEDNEEYANDDNMNALLYHDSSLDEPFYPIDDEEEYYTDTGDDSENQELHEGFDDGEDCYESKEDDCIEHTTDDNDEANISYSLMKSQLFAMEFILKYPMAAAAIPCDIYTKDGVFVAQEYGQRQAEIVADVFKEYKKYFENRLKELKQRQYNNGFLISPSASVLDF